MSEPHHNLGSVIAPEPDNASPVPVKKLYFGLSSLHWLYLISFYLATILTWVVSQNIQQFHEHGAIAFESGFPGDLEQWSRQGGWENIHFESDAIVINRTVDKSSYAFRTFTLDSSANREHEKLLVTGSVKTRVKKPDDDISDGGALMVWLQDDSEDVVSYLNIGKLDGKEDSYEVSRSISLPENITRFSLVLTNKQTSAEFALENASIEMLTEQPLFSKVRIVVFLAWAIMLAIALYYIFRHASASVFGIITALISLTILGVLMPESMSSETIKPLYAKLQTMTGLTGDAVLEHAFKIGHFLFFFLFTLALLIQRKTLQLPVWEILMLTILFATATEGLQLYLSDRTFRISDLLIDYSAIMVATMFAIMLASLKSDTPAPTQ